MAPLCVCVRVCVPTQQFHSCSNCKVQLLRCYAFCNEPCVESDCIGLGCRKGWNGSNWAGMKQRIAPVGCNCCQKGLSASDVTCDGVKGRRGLQRDCAVRLSEIGGDRTAAGAKVGGWPPAVGNWLPPLAVDRRRLTASIRSFRGLSKRALRESPAAVVRRARAGPRGWGRAIAEGVAGLGHRERQTHLPGLLRLLLRRLGHGLIDDGAVQALGLVGHGHGQFLAGGGGVGDALGVHVALDHGGAFPEAHEPHPDL